MWMKLPAARLGQRAATAFVATPNRQITCSTRLAPGSLDFYLGSAGLYAMNAGDLHTASEYIGAAVNQCREAQDFDGTSVGLMNLAECLCWQGQVLAATVAAADALEAATTAGARSRIHQTHAWRARVADVSGDTTTAEQEFLTAHNLAIGDSNSGTTLFALRGTWWGDFLLRTSRPLPAWQLTVKNLTICERYGWNDDIARCRLLLARLHLAKRNVAAARPHLTAALATLRVSDYLLELTVGLLLAAELARRTGNLDIADDRVTEALTIAAPRGLVPSHAAALAARARIEGDRHRIIGSQSHLHKGRDAADTALRLTGGANALPWEELAAVRAHYHLDQIERVDHGWGRRAKTLQSKLIPSGLTPDPLAAHQR